MWNEYSRIVGLIFKGPQACQDRTNRMGKFHCSFDGWYISPGIHFEVWILRFWTLNYDVKLVPKYLPFQYYEQAILLELGRALNSSGFKLENSGSGLSDFP